MRHVLLHLLHPGSFERITSGLHRQSIARTYACFVEDPNADVDEQLPAIRRRLEKLLKKPTGGVDHAPPVFRRGLFQ